MKCKSKSIHLLFKKIKSKMSSAKWWPFCSGEDELNSHCLERALRTSSNIIQMFCMVVKLSTIWKCIIDFINSTLNFSILCIDNDSLI